MIIAIASPIALPTPCTTAVAIPRLAAGSETSAVVREAKVTFPEGKGYKMDLEVMAQSIQAEPKDAVESAWGVTVNSDGSLTVVR